jgi:hypothetical protein
VAATFALLPAGTPDSEFPSPDALAKSDRLRRSGFLGIVTWVRPLSVLAPIYAALVAGDLANVEAREPDMVSFYCPRCKAVYCEHCWQIGPPVFDEEMPGFYDCTYGTCPRQHRRMVDD